MTGHRPWSEVRDELRLRRLRRYRPPPDLPGVRHRDERGTYLVVRDGTPADDEDVVRLYPDPRAGTPAEPTHPLTLVGALGDRLTLDDAVALGHALLALVTDRDRAELVHRFATSDETREGAVAELAEELP